MKAAGLKDIRLSPWPNPPTAANEALRVDYVSGVDDQKDWGVLIPCRQAGDWAVVLHGHGSGGDQLLTRPDIRDGWLPALRSAGLGIFSPNLRGNAWMSPAAAEDLSGLMTWLRSQYPIGKMFLCGGSMGGTSALIYAVLYPDQLDGVMALCPAAELPGYWRWAMERAGRIPVLGEIASAIESNYGATPDQSPELYASHSAWSQRQRLTMPLALAHGTGDVIIPFEPTRRLAEALNGRGNLRYDEIPGGDHDGPVRLFPPLLEWLLDRSKGDAMT